jgi:hypothetical protein
MSQAPALRPLKVRSSTAILPHKPFVGFVIMVAIGALQANGLESEAPLPLSLIDDVHIGEALRQAGDSERERPAE